MIAAYKKKYEEKICRISLNVDRSRAHVTIREAVLEYTHAQTTLKSIK